MDIHLIRSNIAEYQFHDQGPAVGLTLVYVDAAPVHDLVIDIAEEGSDLAGQGFGMYLNIDGHAFYGGVSDFKYDVVEERILLTLVQGKHKNIDTLVLDLPRPLALNEREILQKVTRAYDSSKGNLNPKWWR
jgi:hypothetical protein